MAKLDFIARMTRLRRLDSLGLIRIEKTEFGFFESFPAGVHLAGEKLKSYVDQFKKISFSKNGSI